MAAAVAAAGEAARIAQGAPDHPPSVDAEPALAPAPLRFGGDLTLARAEEVRAILLAALGGDRFELLVDCAEATAVDVTFIQLLVAAQRAAIAQGKSLRLSDPPAGALAAALTRCGIAPDHVRATDPFSWTNPGTH